MDTTIQTCLQSIKNQPYYNRKVVGWSKIVKNEIHGLATTAYLYRGTNVARMCNAEAFRLEKELRLALSKFRTRN